MTSNNQLRIALERIVQAAEQYLMTDGDQARMLELRRNLGEAVTDASLALYPPAADHHARLAADDFHDAVCTGPSVPAGFTCSHPSHARLAAGAEADALRDSDGFCNGQDCTHAAGTEEG